MFVPAQYNKVLCQYRQISPIGNFKSALVFINGSQPLVELQVDKAGVDLLHENSGRYTATLEPWILVRGPLNVKLILYSRRPS